MTLYVLDIIHFAFIYHIKLITLHILRHDTGPPQWVDACWCGSVCVAKFVRAPNSNRKVGSSMLTLRMSLGKTLNANIPTSGRAAQRIRAQVGNCKVVDSWFRFGIEQWIIACLGKTLHAYNFTKNLKHPPTVVAQPD